MHSSTAQTDVIEVRQLWKIIENPPSRVEILRDITFSVPRGQFLAIMGASGSGKSTLLGLLAGLDTVTSGSIVLDGVDITNLREDALARLRGRKIGFVFQSYQLVPTLTAEENVLLPAELSGYERQPRRRAKELLERVGLSNRAHHYPVQLSGGEQQRVALARAFITQPPILMADEPTGNLDSANGQHVLDLLVQLNREEKDNAASGDTRSPAWPSTRTASLPCVTAACSATSLRRIRWKFSVDSRNRSERSARVRFALRTASKIAWRDLHAAPAKFLFVVLAVAVGVAALSGVKGFGYAFKGMLLRNAKQLIAADVQAQTWNDPTPDQLKQLQRIARAIRFA